MLESEMAAVVSLYTCRPLRADSLSNHGGGWLGARKLDGSFRASMISANLFSILSSRGALLEPSFCAPLPMLWHNFLFSEKRMIQGLH